MSPRAACRLGRLGFPRVYDYVGGLADWQAAGLPLEGEPDDAVRVAAATRPDIPTCEITASIAEARARLADPWQECVVLDCDGVVAGVIRDEGWDATDETAVDHVMRAGPTTVRADEMLEPLVGRMQHRGTRLVLVTTPQGQLLGAVLRQEAERLLSGKPAKRVWQDCDGCPGRWVPGD